MNTERKQAWERVFAVLATGDLVKQINAIATVCIIERDLAVEDWRCRYDIPPCPNDGERHLMSKCPANLPPPSVEEQLLQLDANMDELVRRIGQLPVAARRELLKKFKAIPMCQACWGPPDCKCGSGS